MQINTEISSKKVIEFLQRKRRYGRSLTGEELAQFLEISLTQETENMSSEALQSLSAFRNSLEWDMF